MVNASQISCAVGYDLYCTYYANGGSISLEQINAHLKGKGFDPVSRRTFRHFAKLLRHHYDYYIPINQLDVAVSKGLAP